MTSSHPILVWTGFGEFYKFLRQQRPEKFLARITDKAGHFGAAVKDNERRCKNDGRNILQIFRSRVADVDPPERRTSPLRGIRIRRTDLGMPTLAPRARVAFEHHKLGGTRRAGRAAQRQYNCETTRCGQD